MGNPARVVLALLALTLALAPQAVSAQPYPSKPITLLVPFPAGSTTDLVGRILSDELAKATGQNGGDRQSRRRGRRRRIGSGRARRRRMATPC